MECVMKGPSAHTYILLCLFLLSTAVGMMHWTLDTKSTSNPAPSSLWQLESASYLSAGNLANLEHVVQYYRGRGALHPPPGEGYGTSRFLLEYDLTQSSQDIIRFAINTAHNFNPDVSAWAAVTALGSLPDHALPYVLLCKSLAWNPGFSVARKQCIETAKGLSLRSSASRQEVLYVDIEYCSVEHAGSESSEELCVRDGYKKLFDAYPEDVDAKALFAWYLVDKSIDKFGAPIQPMRSEAQKNLKGLFKSYPWHHGIAHYIIHAWEDSLQPEEALQASNRVLSMCAKSPHMVHMVGHIFYLLGDYQQASAYFSASHNLETCPGHSYTDGEMTRHINTNASFSPSFTCGEPASLSWCAPYCNNSLHNWEMHHNIAFEIMTLAQAGQLESVRKWAEVELAMRPWEESVSEKVVFPLVFSPMASRSLARFYFQGLLCPIDAFLSASLWVEAERHAERVILHVQTQQEWMLSKMYQMQKQLRGSKGGALREYVISAANDFTSIPLHVYRAKKAYAALMGSVFTSEHIFAQTNRNTHILVRDTSVSEAFTYIKKDIDYSVTEEAFDRMQLHVSILNASLAELKQGDVSYSVIDRNVKALLCNLKEAEGVVAFSKGLYLQSVSYLQEARDMSSQNITLSIIPYNEPIVIPRPISETLGAVYEHIDQPDLAVTEYVSILASPLHKERSWTQLAIGRLFESQKDIGAGIVGEAYNYSEINEGRECLIYRRLINGSWRHADSSLQSVQYVREYVMRHC